MGSSSNAIRRVKETERRRSFSGEHMFLDGYDSDVINTLRPREDTWTLSHTVHAITVCSVNQIIQRNGNM